MSFRPSPKMIVNGLDPAVISKLTLQQVEHVTCVECCKYYIAPETALCGHTLCHGCWIGRRSCASCAASLDRRALKLNLPLQKLTEHVHSLSDAFEKLFNIKLDEFVLDFPENKVEKVNDPTKNVKDWLASSQNHFSTPMLSSQQSIQDLVQPIELSTSNIQIHTKELISPSCRKLAVAKTNKNVITNTIESQEDWDKIEILPDTEDICIRDKENVIGPMDIEPFFVDEEYTTDHPRRSSRKKEVKNDSNCLIRDNDNISTEKQSSKNSNTEIDKKSGKAKQNWSNVKKMTKEFSKLNKKNKNKLNVSIEMCKKAQSVSNQPKLLTVTSLAESQQGHYVIDDNTPDIVLNKNGTNMDLLATKDNVNKNNNNNDKNDMKHTSAVQNGDIGEVMDVKMSLSNKKIINIDGEKSSLNRDPVIKSVVNTVLETNSNQTINVPILKKSNLYRKTTEEDCIKITQTDVEPTISSANDDNIEISIKVGNIVTNVIIKKKLKDMQIKLNMDRQVQTSLGPFGLNDKNEVGCSPICQSNKQNVEVDVENRNIISKTPATRKSMSTKKNTESAETATANFEITESVEKELSDLMECVATANNNEKEIGKTSKPVSSLAVNDRNTQINIRSQDVQSVQDLELFNSGSVKELDVHDVQLLKNTKHAHSEILKPSMKNKRPLKSSDKRDRGINDESELPCTKKQKIDSETSVEISTTDHQDKISEIIDSEPMHYDAIMSQVFANIDADMQAPDNRNLISVNKIDKNNHNNIVLSNTRKLTPKDNAALDARNTSKELANQKYSENMFSMAEKDSEPHSEFKNNKPHTQQHVENISTSGICHTLDSSNHDDIPANDIEIMEQFGTPLVNNDDSDKSVVEETPQKELSFSKMKQKSDISNKTTNVNEKQQVQKINNNKHSDSQIIKSIINVSDTLESSNKDTTIVELDERKQSLETPLTINKFVDRIQHNSTPVARKALNFENDNIEDPEQTLCPTTTQEKEFIDKVFQQTPNFSVKRPVESKNNSLRENKVFCLAGSCLTSTELVNVKNLCRIRGWKFSDKYLNDLTHLIVGVDEENKSQRSIKYMCALAASKWIVTYTWVEKCLQSKNVDELPYEALDASGEPGPMRSRLAKSKLFEGFTFYCMPPFSVLNEETLKTMLEAAGARVVNNVQGVKVTRDNALAILLAEPEHTQEDRFTYLAMELSIVPVNYEWVLNCLGNYKLSSLHDLLLCPPSLLPESVKEWPHTLMIREMDDSDII